MRGQNPRLTIPVSFFYCDEQIRVGRIRLPAGREFSYFFSYILTVTQVYDMNNTITFHTKGKRLLPLDRVSMAIRFK